jgi:hypothetical protein
MTRGTFTIAAIAFLCIAAAGEQPTVIFLSPCECQGFHGKNRWIAISRFGLGTARPFSESFLKFLSTSLL